ncbi:hypothetical protein AMTRI_Chr06g173590 [Amborella trichopoda]
MSRITGDNHSFYCRDIAINLHCKTKFLMLMVSAYERIDLGFIAKSFGLDPCSVKINGHSVSRDSDFVSSLPWRSILSFFEAKGLSTGNHLHDAILVDGRPLCVLDSRGSQNASVENRNVFCDSKEEINDIGSKRKTSLEDQTALTAPTCKRVR